MLDKMNDFTYTDPCTIALSHDQQLYESMCVEEQLSNDEYLDKLDKRLYQRSHGY